MKTIVIDLLTAIGVIAISFGVVVGALVLFGGIGRLLGAS